jgi:hypothetical protein
VNHSPGASVPPRAASPAQPSPHSQHAPAPSAEPLEWYYARDGQTFGPLAQSTLMGQFIRREVGIECHIWHQSFTEWKPAYATPPFSDALLQATKAAEVASRPPTPSRNNPPPSDQARSQLQALFSRVSSPDPDDLQEVDLDIDGASRVVSARDLRAQASSATSTDDPIIDLDIDGASRVVNIKDIRPPPTISPAAPSIDLDVDGNSSLLNVNALRGLPPSSSAAPIQARSSEDILAELQELQDAMAARDADLSPEGNEQSMVIQLDLLHAQQRQSRNRTLGIAVGVGVGVFLIVFLALSLIREPEVTTRGFVEHARSVSVLQGLTDDQLLALAPEDDFEIVVSDTASDQPTPDLPTPDLPPADSTAPDQPSSDPLADTPPLASNTTSKNTPKDPQKGSTKTPDKNPKTLAQFDNSTNTLNIDLSKQGSTHTSNTSTKLGTSDPSAAPKTVSGATPSLTSSDPFKSTRRATVDIGTTPDNSASQLSNLAPKSSGISVKDRTMFKSGITKIANSVHTCSRRFADKVGTSLPSRINLRLTVNATGALEKVQIDGTFPPVFTSCLKEHEPNWKFGPRPGGSTVEFRQAFLINQ